MTGRLLDGLHEVPDEMLVESASQDFERSARLRSEAEQAHSRWVTDQRISRALYFWRSQASGQSRKKPGISTGRFLAPARILATETRQDETGHLRPGSAVWCVRGRNLLKCCPEQLRRASEREELLDSLAQDHSQAGTPWTISRVAEEIGGNQFEDISHEARSPAEWASSSQGPIELGVERATAQGRLSGNQVKVSIGMRKSQKPHG